MPRARSRSGTSPTPRAPFPWTSRLRRRLRGRLHLQVPQRRPRRPGLHLCETGACPQGPPRPLRLARPRGALRLRPRLPPRPGIERMRVGTPPILQLAALDAALDVWEGVDLHDLRARSIELTQAFIAEVEARCPDLALASPATPRPRQPGELPPPRRLRHHAGPHRGGRGGRLPRPRHPALRLHAALHRPERRPQAAEILEGIMSARAWDRDEFRRRAAVT
jgi:hypothetical protein